MPKPRISAALRDALTELQAGADPDQVAAALIKTRQEAVVLRDLDGAGHAACLILGEDLVS